MSNNRGTDPLTNPEQAAHEIVLELIKANAISSSSGTTTARGREISGALKAVHQTLTAYYKELDGK